MVLNLSVSHSVSDRNLADFHSGFALVSPVFHSHSIRKYTWQQYASDQVLRESNNSVMSYGFRFCSSLSPLRLLAYGHDDCTL